MAQCAFLLRGFPVFYQVGELHSGELLLDLLRNLPIDTTEHTVTVPIAAAALTAVIVLTQTAAQGNYILPDSASSYLTEADLAGLTKEELRLARNEIYARHGRIFKDADLNAYFMSKSWYTPLYEPEQFDEDAMFNEYEKANRQLISDYEEKMGY